MSQDRILSVRVAIPHYFQEDQSIQGTSFGSSRSGNKDKRSLALYNCISSILAQSYSSSDLFLDLASQRVNTVSQSLDFRFSSIHSEINIFVCGNSYIDFVLQTFSTRVNIHHVQIDNPRELPKYVSNWLISHPIPFDLNYFTEDDIVIRDPIFFAKQDWFLCKTNFQFVLMPHRFEITSARFPQKLYIDGANSLFSDPVAQSEHTKLLSQPVVEARFPGIDETIYFVQAANPHSGTFMVRREQLDLLKDVSDRDSFYISPLESASSGLVRSRYPVLKTKFEQSGFLEVCHDNPSFLHLLNNWEFT